MIVTIVLTTVQNGIILAAVGVLSWPNTIPAAFSSAGPSASPYAYFFKDRNQKAPFEFLERLVLSADRRLSGNWTNLTPENTSPCWGCHMIRQKDIKLDKKTL
ncbi:uncharacterized protein Dsimw501_GD29504 [Drosophila simulans]|uniref:Uncharacterized protein n=1 Tax=Drosophila simulans TaxID=7240 RepID=A0A0J9TSX7_DROSI|nr:uncharacterized protein LOC27209347 [Drosophila simulans]KMY91390.1 uncharacterized protein Dsimw501_GD29504 [Drosophila simulans]